MKFWVTQDPIFRKLSFINKRKKIKHHTDYNCTWRDDNINKFRCKAQFIVNGEEKIFEAIGSQAFTAAWRVEKQLKKNGLQLNPQVFDEYKKRKIFFILLIF